MDRTPSPKPIPVVIDGITFEFAGEVLSYLHRKGETRNSTSDTVRVAGPQTRYQTRPRQTTDYVYNKCSCQSQNVRCRPDSADGSSCMNVAQEIECTAEICSWAEDTVRCGFRQLQDFWRRKNDAGKDYDDGTAVYCDAKMGQGIRSTRTFEAYAVVTELREIRKLDHGIESSHAIQLADCSRVEILTDHRLLNHACDPNCEIRYKHHEKKSHLVLCVKGKPVQTHTPLNIDYRSLHLSDGKPIPCLCRPGCENFVGGRQPRAGASRSSRKRKLQYYANDVGHLLQQPAIREGSETPQPSALPDNENSPNVQRPVRHSDEDEADRPSTDKQEKMYNMYYEALKSILQLVEGNKGRFKRTVKDRLVYESDLYIKDLKRTRIIKPLSAEEYMAQKGDANAMRYAHVLCSQGEARSILEDASPKVPLLVEPSEGDDASDKLVEELLCFLSTKDTIDVHRWDKVIDEYDQEAEWRQPDRLDARDAVELFRDPSHGPINFLNLVNIEDNEVPPCLAGIPAYSILRNVSEDNSVGKRQKSNWTDLASCRAFTILGKTGAISQPHWDRPGVITTARNRGGLKAWLTWPRLTVRELLEWSADESPSPSADPFLIFLPPGYTLIQPPITVHSPGTQTDCRILGTMCWDSRDMAATLGASLLDFKRPNNTNEPPANQFYSIIMQINDLWTKKHPAWPWGDDKKFEEWSGYIKELKALEQSKARRTKKPKMRKKS